MRIVYGNSLVGGITGSERALGERAVADVAALGAAHEAGLADRVRREVVVVDVALLVLDAEVVDALELAGAAQREQAQSLRLAAGEEGAAVRARDDADLAGDRPDLVGARGRRGGASRRRCGRG